MFCCFFQFQAAIHEVFAVAYRRSALPAVSGSTWLRRTLRPGRNLQKSQAFRPNAAPGNMRSAVLLIRQMRHRFELLDEIADGLRKPGLLCRLDELEQRKQDLRSEIMAAEAGPELPRLHGNLAEVYRAKVARLREAFLADGGTET